MFTSTLRKFRGWLHDAGGKVPTTKPDNRSVIAGTHGNEVILRLSSHLHKRERERACVSVCEYKH